MDQIFVATIIAKGAPVKTSDGSIVMCSIAVCQEFGLVRLYPLRVSDGVRVWSKVKVKARRSNKDNRKESWRVLECEAVGAIDNRDCKIDLLDECILHSGTKDPIAYQNDKRASIAIVKPCGRVGMSLEPRCDDEYFSHNPEETWVYTQNEMPFKPYAVWSSIQGVKHKSHIVAQEVYVGMLNNSSNPSKVYDIMRFGDPDYEHWLVLGNTKDRRNIWVLPHVHRFKKTDFRTCSSLLIKDGSGDAWPYLNQEDLNAKDAGPQMLFEFITQPTD